MVRKVANFTKDSISFAMKPFTEAKFDIQRLAAAFKKENAFKFNESEMAYFERLHELLTPKAKARKHMAAAMDYLK